jgi:hypothetical protein
MPDEPPKSRPEPPADPAKSSVYGDQWGRSGKQNEAEKGRPDRSKPIETPPEPIGTGEPEGPAPV